jgi:hypothetical protein
MERRLGLLLLLNRGTREDNACHLNAHFLLALIALLTGIHNCRNPTTTHNFNFSALMHQSVDIPLMLFTTSDQWTDLHNGHMKCMARRESCRGGSPYEASACDRVAAALATNLATNQSKRRIAFC